MRPWSSKGAGFVGKGCLGESFSPGTFDGGTGRSSMGQIGAPEGFGQCRGESGVAIVGHRRVVGVAARDDIEIAVPVHIAQGHAPGDVAAQRLPAVAEGPRAIVQPHPVGMVVGVPFDEIKIAVPIHIAQGDAPGEIIAQ